MPFFIEDSKNIILPQINYVGTGFFLKEIKPFFIEDSSTPKSLILNENKDLMWAPAILNAKNVSIGYSIYAGIKDNTILFNSLMSSGDISIKEQNGTLIIDCSVSYTQDGHLKGTNIYANDDRIGFGRNPLRNYKFDIAIPKDTLTTALHVGDGSSGFSMGNGTSNGFIPQIIGMGSDENDAGLYFVGRAGTNLSSNIPLIIFDGRNVKDNSLNNRPILGVTSGTYDDYKFIINYDGKTYIDNNIYVNDIIFNNEAEMQSLKNIIKNLEARIQQLEQNS